MKKITFMVLSILFLFTSPISATSNVNDVPRGNSTIYIYSETSSGTQLNGFEWEVYNSKNVKMDSKIVESNVLSIDNLPLDKYKIVATKWPNDYYKPLSVTLELTKGDTIYKIYPKVFKIPNIPPLPPTTPPATPPRLPNTGVITEHVSQVGLLFMTIGSLGAMCFFIKKKNNN